MELTAKELSQLIKVCGEQKVSKLSISDIVIEFSKQEVIEPVPETVYIPEPIQAIDDKAINTSDASFLDQEDVYAQIMVDDPLAIEEFAMRGDNN